MKNLAAIIFSFLCINVAYGATPTLQNEDSISCLKALEERFYTDFQYFSSAKNIRKEVLATFSMDPSIFFKEMECTHHHFFIFFWYYSYGEEENLCFIRSNRKYFKVKYFEDKSLIFKAIKRNFEQYLRRNLLKELLDPSFKFNKESVLSQAMELYDGKFQMIRKKLTGQFNFETLRETFCFLQLAIDYDVKTLLEIEFHGLYRHMGDFNRYHPFYFHRERFYLLVKSLSNNKSEKFGWPWIANHSNPIFILLYIYYQSYDRHQNFEKSILNEFGFKFFELENARVFKAAIKFLRKTMNLTRQRPHWQLFIPEGFQSPFPEIVSTDDLTVILDQVISKIFDQFHDPKAYGIYFKTPKSNEAENELDATKEEVKKS